jgi:hypothetical protein
LPAAEYGRHYQVTRIKLHLDFCLLPGVNQDCWLLEYPWQLEKNKDWSNGVME